MSLVFWMWVFNAVVSGFFFAHAGISRYYGFSFMFFVFFTVSLIVLASGSAYA